MNLQQKNPENHVLWRVNRTNKQNGKYVTRCKRSIQSRNFDDLRIAYKQQVEALIDGGSDILLVETILILKC
jgi:5-methyltetrahydrofolate--homocysteine methyltransferase